MAAENFRKRAVPYMLGAFIAGGVIIGALESFFITVPKDVEIKDITGDGLDDVVLRENNLFLGEIERYCFIQMPDGGYTRAHFTKREDGKHYLVTEDETWYVNNGKHYVLLQ